MSSNSWIKTLAYRLLCVAVIVGLSGGCSTEHFKAEADEEVYKIIDGKWHDSFGQKANYTVSDVPPSPNDLEIQDAIPPSGIINLAQAVAVATAHNRDYQKQKEDLYLMALDLTLARHQFARQWFGTIDAGYIRDSEDEKLNISSDETKLGFDQLLADGAIVSTSIALDWTRFLTGDPRTSLGSVLSTSITQPLLRGSGRKIAQENLTQAERDALYQIRSFSRYRKAFVVSIVTDYYRVLQQRNRVTNARNNYERGVELRKRSELEADVGRTPPFEADQAKQRELDARDSYVRARQTYQQLLDEFKIRLSLPTDADVELDQDELMTLKTTGLHKLDYELEAATQTALLTRLDLANSKAKIDDAARKVMVAADGLGAELNLIGTADISSTEEIRYSRLEFHRGIYGLGLDADLPLDRKAERNAYREALIVLQQQQREYDNDVATVKLEVRQAYRQLKEAQERYETQKMSLDLAQKRVEGTSLLWENRRARTRDLLESQDALLRAENDLMAALVDYTVAKLNFFRDVGFLQVRPDGMWEQKQL
ncbi:MAG: TolC family protein [Planctomycetota bacterium]|jgi:outer membrane protein TolC